MHSNVSAFPLLNILYSFLFCGKAKASYLAYKYVVGRMLTYKLFIFRSRHALQLKIVVNMAQNCWNMSRK